MEKSREITNYFRKLTSEEKKEQQEQEIASIKAERPYLEAIKRKKEEKAIRDTEERTKESNRRRKQAQREREKVAGIRIGLRDQNGNKIKPKVTIRHVYNVHC
jgi:hypothetical protein